jgi:hypothetical protein
MLPVAAANARVGARPSSFVMVRVWVPGLPTLVPVLGLVRVRTTVSSASGCVSPVTVRVTVWLVLPAGKVTVAGAAKVKSVPLVAVEALAFRATCTVVEPWRRRLS